MPNAETNLVPGDRLAFATIGVGSFPRIVRLTGNEEEEFPSNPRVLIFGANLLGTRLVSTYLNSGCRVTVIEEDLELANKLAGSDIGNHRLLDIINGVHRDIELLKDIDELGFDTIYRERIGETHSILFHKDRYEGFADLRRPDGKAISVH